MTEDRDNRLLILFQSIGWFDQKGEYILRYLRETVQSNNADNFNQVFSVFLERYGDWVKNNERGMINFGFYPFLFQQEHQWSRFSNNVFVGSSGGGYIDRNNVINFEFTPFGEKLLKFLQDEGVKSENDAIRKTSQQVVDALTQIAEINDSRERSDDSRGWSE